MSVAAHLETLVRVELIRRAPEAPEIEYLFRHALVQDAVYVSILKRDRKALHQLVGETLETLYPTRLDEFAVVLAHHFVEAGDSVRAYRYYLHAADHALANYANAEARTLFKLAYAATHDAAEQARALAGQSMTFMRSQQHADAARVAQDALALYTQVGDADGRARMYAMLARAHSASGRIADSLALAHAGLDALADQPETAGLATLLSIASNLSHSSGAVDEAIALQRRARAIIAHTGRPQDRVVILSWLGYLLLTRAGDEAERVLLEAVALVEEHHIWFEGITAYSYLGQYYRTALGDLRRAYPITLRAAELAERIGNLSNIIFNRSLSAYLLIALGEFQAAQATLNALETLVRGQTIGRNAHYVYAVCCGYVHHMQGDFTSALRDFESGRQAALAHGDMGYLISICALGGQLLIDSDRAAEAQAVLEDALEKAGDHLYQASIQVCAQLATIHAHAGRFAQAHARLAQAERQVPGAMPVLDSWSYWQAKAELAACEGDWDEANALYAHTRALFEHSDARWPLAHLLEKWATQCHARGTPAARAQGRALLHEAQALFTTLGVLAFSARTAARLAAWDAET